ncbi:MAG TPA: sigma-70 family RNA polymerase sigma factor [Candidatus Limnocylindrales bacterium]
MSSRLGPDLVAAAQPPDSELVAAMANGRLEALGELYDRHRAAAFGLAYRITGDAGIAEDVVHDAFLGAWRNADRYAPDRSGVKTWLMSIVHHRAIDAVRLRRPTSELPDPDAAPPASLTSPDVWAEIGGRLDAERIRHALDALSAVQREALELAYFGGLTQQEIADRTATPLGTVKSRVRLGLMALRRSLEGANRSTDEPAAGGTDA